MVYGYISFGPCLTLMIYDLGISGSKDPMTLPTRDKLGYRILGSDPLGLLLVRTNSPLIDPGPLGAMVVIPYSSV